MSKWVWATIVASSIFSVPAYSWFWGPDVRKLNIVAYIDKASHRKFGQSTSNIFTYIFINVANNTDYYISKIEAICSAYDSQGNRTFNGKVDFYSNPQIAPKNKLTIRGSTVSSSSIRAECKVTRADGSK